LININDYKMKKLGEIENVNCSMIDQTFLFHNNYLMTIGKSSTKINRIFNINL